MNPKFRTSVYIDGHNLYNNIRRMYESNDTPYDQAKWREVLWLDLLKLSQSFLNPTQELISVKYFTARVTKPKSKVKRQSIYIDALKSLDKLEVIEGKYHDNNPVECQHCHQIFYVSKEKQTDVNLATALLVDVIEDKIDTAYIVSVDSDYKAPLSYIRIKYPQKRIYFEFVETNFSYTLARSSYRPYIIYRERLLKCQLPETITLPSGFVVQRPAMWK